MQVYMVDDFGAVADGVTINSVAVQKAIDACAKTGGVVQIFCLRPERTAGIITDFHSFTLPFIKISSFIFGDMPFLRDGILHRIFPPSRSRAQRTLLSKKCFPCMLSLPSLQHFHSRYKG